MIEKYCIGGLRHIDIELAKKIAEHFGLLGDVSQAQKSEWYNDGVRDGRWDLESEMKAEIKAIKSDWYSRGLRDGGDNVRKEMRQVMGLDL